MSETPPGTSGDSIEALVAAIAESNGRLIEMRNEIAELRGKGTAADGRVVVEVAQDGSLSSLTIDPRAMRLGSEALAEQILAASQEAVKQVSELANEHMEALASGFAALPGGLGLDELGLDKVLTALDDVDRRLAE